MSESPLLLYQLTVCYFEMLIAQTGSNTLAPAAELPGSTPVSNLWWMLPLAAAIFALAWFLRPKKPQLQLPPKSNKDSDRKSAARNKLLASETAKQDPTTEDREPVRTKSNGSKKKKTSKKKLPSNAKPAQPQVMIAVSPPDMSPTQALQNKVPIEKVAADPKPVNAIFEPLREAVIVRKKQQYREESVDAYDSQASAKQRIPEAVSEMFGGKFERIVPRASIRSHADRWPAAAFQPSKSSPTITPRPQPVETVKDEAVSDPVAPAVVNGLKSFVSKVKKSDESSSEPALPPSRQNP